MARYYYDRYSVSSSTRYYWRKYEQGYVIESSPRYEDEVGWNPGLTPFGGGSSYSLNTETGIFSTAGTSHSGVIVDNISRSYTAVGNRLIMYSSRGFDSGTGTYRFVKKTYFSEKGSARGAYISQTTGSYSYKTSGAINADGYWWERGSSYTTYYRGSYVDTIVAEDGTYPDAGRVGTTYWYVKQGRAFPPLKIKVDGQLRESVDGWAKVDGVLKQITSMHIKTAGEIKEVQRC